EAPELELEALAIPYPRRGSETLFGPCDHRDLVERSAARTERESGVSDQSQAQYTHAVDRSAAVRPATDEIERETGVDELLGHDIVEAARTHETDHVPIAREFDAIARDEEHSDRRPARRENAGFSIHDLESSPTHPVGMRAAAAEAVVTAHRVRIADRDRPTARRELAGVNGDTVGEHRAHRFVAGVGGSEGGCRRVGQQGPARGTVGPA